MDKNGTGQSRISEQSGLTVKKQTADSDPSQDFLLQAPQITLPKGGGAIKSIDEKFSVNAVNGTATCNIPLPFSSARGFSPSISLTYDSGAGNGIFGLGWSLNIPSVRRKTEKELPQYFEGIDSDTYNITGAEDLVPVFKTDNAGNYLTNPDGTHLVLEFDSPDARFVIRPYRPRIEGLFSLIQRWTQKSTGDIHWRVISKDNVTSLYGKSPEARITNPVIANNIFEWFLEFTYDDKGNCASYEYKKENLAGIDPSVQHNKNRLNGNAPCTNTYIKRIRYGNVVPYRTHGDPLPTQFIFENVFDYGEHDPSIIPFNESTIWQFRSDAFSTYRSGFEIRTCRLCRRVLLYHHFSELPGGSALIKSLELGYDSNGEDGFTFLKEATLTGYTKHDDGTYTQRSFPPLSFFYQVHSWNTTVQTISPDNLIHAPAGIDNSGYQFVDLYCEGLAGILTEQNGNLFYKQNLGGGNFTPANVVGSRPSFTGLQNVLQLTDLGADGTRQITSWETEPKGFFELDESSAWQPFVPFEYIPNINFRDPNTRLLDLNGDGIADVLITDQDVFTWYSSKGRKGYSPSLNVAVSPDEEKTPAIVFADQTQCIFLADMSGDGLTDIVRIQNGAVCYWPNLGFGKFGSRVSMDHSPVFDNNEQFDSSLIKLADVDGSGTTDIIYLGQNQFRIWLNQQGNAFLKEPKRIDYFPEIDNLARIDVADLLGTGLSCITWSSPSPKNQGAALKYIDLMSSTKPHVLNRYCNNLGKEIQLEYTPSTKYYVDDKLNGKPWVTKLHFPVHCVSKVVAYDRIMKTRMASEYSYHHGCYDHIEREFRGFGRVDQKDAEDIDNFVLLGGGNTVIEQDLHQPPVLTRSWFHTGTFTNQNKILNQFSHEYFQNTVVPENLLTEPVMPSGMSTDEVRQAVRSCKGLLLRKEVYALDGSNLQENPYTVEQHNCVLKIIQPQGQNKYGIFLAHESEAITYQYERNPADPRTAHSMVLEIDPYGNILQQASIVYARRPAGGNEPEQETTHITLTESQFTNEIRDALDFRVPLPFTSRMFEVTGLPAPTGYYQPATVKSDCDAATLIDYHLQPTIGKQKRLVKFSRVQYRGNDGITILPFGTIESKGLLHQAYKAACNQNMLDNTFTEKIAPALLKPILLNATTGAYLFSDGYYWLQSGMQNYDVNRFFLSSQFTDPFGNIANVVYDNNYSIFISKVTDALGNEEIVNKFNYRVLTPYLLQDLNDNFSAVRFDELGLVVRTFAIGKRGIDPGDEFDDTKTELKNAADFPGTEMEYSVTEWYNQSRSAGFNISNYKPHPNFIKTTARETHFHADPQHTSRFRISYAYCGGSGHIVLTKAQAEPGAALQVNADGNVTQIANTFPNLRWTGTGRTITNNKGNAVKQYEPYFSVSPDFDDEKEMVQLGVTPVMHYDPPGRVIRTDFPNGTFNKVEFDSWQQISFDTNDTVKDSDWYAAMGSPDPTGAEPADKDKRSAWLAAKHYNTPTVMRLDSIGRTFLTIADNTTEKLITRIKYDILGRELQITDALNRTVMEYVYNITGEKWKQTSIDAGRRWMINDATGKPMMSWDEMNREFSFTYDELRRLIKSFVKEGAADRVLYAEVKYGESELTAKTDNTRGKPYKSFDQSGVLINVKNDFKGNQLSSTKQLASDYKNIIDWNKPVVLEQEIFENETVFDALNRPIKLISPHDSTMQASEILPAYNEAGLLQKVSVNIRGAASAVAFVTDIRYNAKSQREEIIYGNNTSTKYIYQKETLRLMRLLTTRNAGADILQDLNYTFDPVGNITAIKDDAHADVFFDGEQVTAAEKFEYDALYRLTKATGRKHAGQTDIQPKSELAANSSFRNHPFANSHTINPNDAGAFRNYTEQYQYDKAGNLTEQQHIAKNSSWTRSFIYDNANNLNNHLTAISIGPDTFKYTYDLHGNMQGLETVMSEVWNFMNHFKQAGLGGGGTVYYVYDNSGQRTRKVIERQGGIIRERIYLGGFEIYREKTGSSSVVLSRETLHIMDGEKTIVMVDTPVTRQAGSSETELVRYQYCNLLGSAALELDDAAKTISYEEYFPFGTSSYSTIDATREVPAKRYRFTAKERDEESGLNYHGARYYAPWICRWTSPDPIGIKDGLNIYVYVNNNPVKSADLNGNWGTEMHFAAVYWAGRMQGATHIQALGAAIYSQSLDDFEETAAPSMKIQGTLKTFLAEVPSEGPDQILRANNAHALGLTKEQSQKIANMGIARHNMLFFGVGLHTAGDWLPHANLSVLPSFGHQNNLNEDESPSFMLTSDADHPYQNPKKALATFNIFRDLWSGYLNKGTPAALNNDQLTKLNAFFDEAGKANNWDKMVGALRQGLLQTGVTEDEIKDMYKYLGNTEARKDLIRKVQSIESKKREYIQLWDEIRKIKPSNDQLFIMPDDAIKKQVETELAKQPVAVPQQLPFVTPQQEKDPNSMIRRDIRTTVSAPDHPPYPVYQH